MPKTYTIKAEQINELWQERKKHDDKMIDKRLHAVILRGEGMKDGAIAEKLDTSSKVVSRWVCKYVHDGIEALTGKNQGGNRRNMSFAEEESLLAPHMEQAEKGQLISISEIEREYASKVGHKIGSGQIYRVLARHEWRKVMPRSKHPKKASDEDIEASKKLTQ